MKSVLNLLVNLSLFVLACHTIQVEGFVVSPSSSTLISRPTELQVAATSSIDDLTSRPKRTREVGE
jgi:hypothetical protein